MSGIAAILALDGSPVRPDEWAPVVASLAASGERHWHWADPDTPVVLARTLEEITPEDRHARGLASAGDWQLAGDIRLDGRAELVRALGLAPGEGTLRSDEQLFALALEKWGADAPARLLGTFAVAAWESSRRRLHLWRDANGEAGLFFHYHARRLFVATRPPILFAAPSVPREVDVPGLLNFMSDNRRPGRSALRRIEALGIGQHHIFGADGTHSERRFWTPPDEKAWTRTEIKNPVATLRAALTEAVTDRLRLLGTPAGYCSGGLDSTAIAAIAATELARTGRRYRTYTSVPHPEWREPATGERWENDDSTYVRALVRHHSNIDATFVAVEDGIFLDCLPEIFRETAMPVRNTSNLAWFAAIRALAHDAGARRMFSGDGGNGTISLDPEILPDLLAHGRFGALAAEFRASPRAFGRAGRRLLGALKRRWLGRDTAVREAAAEVAVRLPLNLAAAQALGWQPIPRPPLLRSLAHARRRMVQTAEGGVGIGFASWGRLDPTRGRRVVTLCRLLPPQEFRHGSEGRRLIRRAMAGLVPDEIRLRTSRGAQAPDYPMLLGRRLSDLREALEFIARDPLCVELLDLAAMRKTLQTWPARANASQALSLIPLERGLAFGLYLCWVNQGLTDLPGQRAVRTLLIGST